MLFLQRSTGRHNDSQGTLTLRMKATLCDRKHKAAGAAPVLVPIPVHRGSSARHRLPPRHHHRLREAVAGLGLASPATILHNPTTLLANRPDPTPTQHTQSGIIRLFHDPRARRALQGLAGGLGHGRTLQAQKAWYWYWRSFGSAALITSGNVR